MKYQTYTKYKPSGVEWIGEIPDDWNNRRLKSIIFKIENGQWGGDELGNNSDWFVLRVADFNEMKFNLKKELTVRNVSNKRLRLYDGDLVMEKSGGGEKQLVGRVVQFVNNENDDNKYTYSNFVGKLSVSNELNNRFLLYFFKTFYNNKVNYKHIKQTTGIQNFDCDSLLQNEFIALPAKDEQNKIANFLDNKTKQIDDLIKKDKRLIELLKEKRIALINKAVTKGLDDKVKLVDSGVDWIGEIPKGWEVRKLKFVGKSIIGLTYSPDNVTDENGTLVLRSSNVQNNKILLGDNVYVDKEVPRKLITREGDILICTRNGSKRLIGKSAYITKENSRHTFGVFMTIFRSKHWRFASYVLNSDIFMQQASLYLTSTINQLTVNNLDNVIIALPPAKEQEKIVAYLNKRTSEIDRHTKKIEKRAILLEKYKKSLIYNAVTGKIKVC